MGLGARAAGSLLSGRFRLTRKLGEGGMGEVYEADTVRGGPRVALKVLRAEYFADTLVRSRFVDEAEVAMRLLHPNIVRVLECAQTDEGLPYLVMELLEGVPLAAYMKGGARIPVPQAAAILQGVLAGLGAAHAQAIVHRDLKPDNVFLTRDPDGRFVVKVLDFGIAKVMDVAGGMGNRTRAGMLLGTPAYMSPEQARNARDVDQRTDLWSAGVLFYEMIGGQSAFPAPTEFARLAALLTVEPQPIEQLDPALAHFGPFLRRALAKDRDERFTSATEMAHALGAVLAVGPSVPPEAPRAPAIAATLSSAEAPGPRNLVASFRPSPAGSPAGSGASIPAASAVPPSASAAPPTGTLASPAVRKVSDPPAHVPVVAPSEPVAKPVNTARPLGATLESRPPGSTTASRRASQQLVVIVLGAFLAGVIVGWLAARI